MKVKPSRVSKYSQVYDTLAGLYGVPVWRSHMPPVDVLVSTIISQNTSDHNRDIAFDRLKARFESWEAVRDASTNEVVAALRPAGLANQKAPRIQNALQALGQPGGISLDHVADLPLPEAKEWLMALPGVGPKTAAIVLLFAFGRAAFPVDTHVHRVTGRLGLIPPKMSAERAHTELEQTVPADHYYAFHLNLIRHGREVCRARNPRCQDCPLRLYCDYGQGLAEPQA